MGFGFSIGKCSFKGNKPSHGSTRDRLYVLHNRTVKITQTRGGFSVWTGNGDVAVIYKCPSEVGNHIFEVTGSVQQCNAF